MLRVPRQGKLPLLPAAASAHALLRLRSEASHTSVLLMTQILEQFCHGRDLRARVRTLLGERLQCLGELFDDNLLKEMQDAFYLIELQREREISHPLV